MVCELLSQKVDFWNILRNQVLTYFVYKEIKLQEGQIDLNLEGYYTYWNYAVKKDIQELLFFRKKNRFQLHMV